jgi:hypothetical protein
MSELTREIIEGVMSYLPKTPRYIGFAMCPRDCKIYKQELEKIRTADGGNPEYAGHPVICDPRLNGDKIEAFTNEEAWNARVREQFKYEANTPPGRTLVFSHLSLMGICSPILIVAHNQNQFDIFLMNNGIPHSGAVRAREIFDVQGFSKKVAMFLLPGWNQHPRQRQAVHHAQAIGYALYIVPEPVVIGKETLSSVPQCDKILI